MLYFIQEKEICTYKYVVFHSPRRYNNLKSVHIQTQITFPFPSPRPPKTTKEHRPRGRRWCWPRHHEEAAGQGGGKSHLRKGPIVMALDRTSSSKGTSPALSNGPATFGCRGKRLFSIRVWKCHLPVTSSPRAWTTQQLRSCSGWPTRTNQRQSKRRSRDCWPGWRYRLPAKEEIPPRGHLSFEQGLTVTTLVENRKAWP